MRSLRYIFTIILAALSLSAAAQSDSLASAARWERAQRAYVEGNYELAAEEYRAIADGGEYSLKLYYNLGNAYFKLGDMGRAILFYNRALRLAPSNEDVRHNLSLAESQIKDRITAVPEFFVKTWMRALRNAMSCTAWSILSLLAAAAFLAMVLLFLLASPIVVRKMGFYGGVVMLLLFVCTTSLAVASRNDILSREGAVVLSSAISVKSSPDCSATDLFVLHEGTKLRILTEVDGWYEVVIADGKKGWIDSHTVEQI